MSQPLRKLTVAEANAPKPKMPDHPFHPYWAYYHSDLACWKATQAERYLSGIEEEKRDDKLRLRD